MKMPFYTYQSTGNDFIPIDNQDGLFPNESTSNIQKLCHRQFDIGADGWIVLEFHLQYDVFLESFNGDGRVSTVFDCAKGRIVRFASYLDVLTDNAQCMAADELDTAIVYGNNVALQMGDLDKVKQNNTHASFDLGLPHNLQGVSDLNMFLEIEHRKKMHYTVKEDANANIHVVEKLKSNTFAVCMCDKEKETEIFSCDTDVARLANVVHEKRRNKYESYHT